MTGSFVYYYNFLAPIPISADNRRLIRRLRRPDVMYNWMLRYTVSACCGRPARRNSLNFRPPSVRDTRRLANSASSDRVQAQKTCAADRVNRSAKPVGGVIGFLVSHLSNPPASPLPAATAVPPKRACRRKIELTRISWAIRPSMHGVAPNSQ